MLSETKININKPIKEVWDFFQNPDNLPLWLGGFQKYEHVSGAPGAVGSKTKHYFLERGKELVLEEEILEIIPGKKFTSTLDSSMMTNKVTNKFTDLGNGQTEYVLSTEVQFKGFLMKQLAPLMKGEFRKRQEKDLKTLKEVLEKKTLS